MSCKEKQIRKPFPPLINPDAKCVMCVRKYTKEGNVFIVGPWQICVNCIRTLDCLLETGHEN